MRFQKRKFLVTLFSKKEILFQTKKFKNWIIQDSIKEISDYSIS